MDPIEGSETSAFKPQTPGKYPKVNILHKEHCESLKSRQHIYRLSDFNSILTPPTPTFSPDGILGKTCLQKLFSLMIDFANIESVTRTLQLET